MRNDESVKDDIEKAIGKMVHASENGDHGVLDAFENAYQPVLDGMLETLSRLRINFDEFTKESMFVTNGDVSNIMQKLSTLAIHGVADNGAEYLDLALEDSKGKLNFSIAEVMEVHCMLLGILPTISGNSQCDTLINVLGEDS